MAPRHRRRRSHPALHCRLPARADGLRAETIERVQVHVAARDDQPAWQALPQDQRLDECFPAYHGIGSWELLDELGIVAEYVDMSDPSGMIHL